MTDPSSQHDVHPELPPAPNRGADAPRTPRVSDELRSSEHPHLSRQRLSDAQAFTLLAVWFVFRAITQRVGLGVGPRLLDSTPWVIPLLNNSFLLLIQAGTGTAGRPGQLVATAITSVFMSTLVGLILYWAGWRFGHRLAHMAQRPGSPWAGVWNPKQIARAERWMDRWGMAAIVLVRATELFVVPITLVAGASEMKFRRFLIANTTGAVGFAALWLWVGGVAQRRWPWLKDWIANVYGPWALRIGIGLIVLVVLLMVLGQWLEDRKPPQDDPSTDDDQTRSTTTPSQGSSVTPPENE